MLMKIEILLLERDFSLIICTLMFIDSIHHLYMEEGEDQKMVRVSHYADLSQKHQLMEKLINIFLYHICFQFFQQPISHVLVISTKQALPRQLHNSSTSQNFKTASPRHHFGLCPTFGAPSGPSNNRLGY